MTSICCDSKCHLSVKLIKNVMDEIEHEKHYVVQFDFLRDEIKKTTNPIKKLLNLLDVGKVIQRLEEKEKEISQIFESFIKRLIEDLKNDVYKAYKEYDLMRNIHELFAQFNLTEISERQIQLSQLIPRFLDQNNLLTITHSVLSAQIEPYKTLEEFEDKIKGLCPPPVIINVDEPLPNFQVQYKTKIIYKSESKYEDEIIQQVVALQNPNEVDIDLNGQMINRTELRQSRLLFQEIKKHSKTLVDVKIKMNSTNMKDLQDLKNMLMFLNLRSLTVSLGNTKVIDQSIHDLGKGISNLKNLEKLELSLWNTNVSDVNEIGRALGKLKTLLVLEILLGNTLVKDISELGKGISQNIRLYDLSINLEFTKVLEIRTFAEGIQKLKQIKEFELDLLTTSVDPKIRKNFFSLNHFLNDWKNFLNSV